MRKGSKKHLTLRWCWHCQQYKSISSFYKDISDPIGYDNICKSCKGQYYREYQHKYYLKHRDTLLPRHRISALKSQEKRVSDNRTNK